MLLSKYQRFVAWRYLLEQEQRLNTEICILVGVCLWGCLGLGIGCYFYPLVDGGAIAGPRIPVVMTIVMAMGVALQFLSFVGMMLFVFRWIVWRFGVRHRALRPPSPLIPILLCWYGSAVAIAMFGLYSGATYGATWFEVIRSGAYSLVFLVTIAVTVPCMLSVLRSWRQGLAPGRGRFLITMVLMPVNVMLLLIAKLCRIDVRRMLTPALVVETLLCAGGGLVAVFYGTRGVLWPALFPEGEFSVLAWTSGSFLLAGLVCLAVRRKRFALCAATFCVALCLSGLVLACTLFCVDVATVNLSLWGGWDQYTPPMDIVIPAYICGAVGVLACVILVVRYHFTFFTTVSIGGVTIGTMALVIVLGVMSGFENDLRGKILGFNAHIQISHAEELHFSGYQEVQGVLEETQGVVGYAAFLLTEAYMSTGIQYSNVIFKGIDPERVAGVTEIFQHLEPGDDRALEKIWPLAKDGRIIANPGQREGEDRGGADDEGPIDYSGGADSLSKDREVADDDGPIDYSGGADSVADIERIDRKELNGGTGDVDAMEPVGSLERRGIPSRGWQERRQGGRRFGNGAGTGLLPHDFISPEIAVLDGILVGRELAKNIGLSTDHEIRVISPLPDVSPDGLSIPRIKNYRIAGKFFSGMYEYDLKYVYCSLRSLQSFLDLDDVVNGIEVRVNDPTQTGAIVKKLSAALGDQYLVQDWKELNKALFSALKLEKIAMFLVLVIIVLVASFSIVGNLIMVVVEKAKEIAILKTLGSSDRGVMKIFITQGFFIGLVGTGLGIGLGLGACYLNTIYGVPLDPDVYYIDKLPILVEPLSVLTVGFAGAVISVLATIYPALIAAKMRPVKGLSWS